MDGVLVVDKPQGMTSHDVVAVARRSLGERRIGHTGTLDPLATGVLPLACGRATRLVRFLTASDKDYEAGIRFGLTTDSWDITGRELTRSGIGPGRDALEAALASLRGEYLQVPPAFSAKKIAGQRAYALARRDEPVPLAAVRVRVWRADLVDVTGNAARVSITCSAGFYVRSFAQTLGELVGTGACLESLRRTRAGEFGLHEAVTLDQLQQHTTRVDDCWIGLDRLLVGLPSVRLNEEGRRRVSHGQEVGRAHRVGETQTGASILEHDPVGAQGQADAWVRLLDERGCLLALAPTSSSSAADVLHPAVVLI